VLPGEEFATARRRAWSYRVKRTGKRIPNAREDAMGDTPLEAMALFGFLAVGAIAVFTMISISVWSDARRKEREAYYKADMMKKIAESQGPGATSALELLREQDRIAATRTRQGLKIGGLVMVAIGLGLMVFLRALVPDVPVYWCGLLVLLIGMALYGGSFVVTNSAA
jgi:hypothetical protein